MEDAFTLIWNSGLAILNETMAEHRFELVQGGSGNSSGGRFASAVFRRGDRSLEVNFRYALGMVSYHLGKASLSHDDFMLSVLGKPWASHYPGFSNDPLDGFRHLREDLEQFASDFLLGSDTAFLCHVKNAAALRSKIPKLP